MVFYDKSTWHLVTDCSFQLVVVEMAIVHLATVSIIAKPSKLRLVIVPSELHNVRLSASGANYFPFFHRPILIGGLKLSAHFGGVGYVESLGIPNAGLAAASLT